jgi:hypothetical protein
MANAGNSGGMRLHGCSGGMAAWQADKALR